MCVAYTRLVVVVVMLLLLAWRKVARPFSNILDVCMRRRGFPCLQLAGRGVMVLLPWARKSFCFRPTRDDGHGGGWLAGRPPLRFLRKGGRFLSFFFSCFPRLVSSGARSAFPVFRELQPPGQSTSTKYRKNSGNDPSSCLTQNHNFGQRSGIQIQSLLPREIRIG